MEMSTQGRTDLEEFEGVVLHSYQDSVGVWTIGIGSTEHPDGTAVKKGENITREQADYYVTLDLAHREKAINKLLTATLTQCEYDMIVSLCYNIGIGNLTKSSVVRSINIDPSIKNKANIIHNWKKWDEAGGKYNVDLLVRRQKELFKYFNGAVTMAEIKKTA